MCVPVNSSNVRSNSESLTAGGPESASVTTELTGVPRVTVDAADEGERDDQNASDDESDAFETRHDSPVP